MDHFELISEYATIGDQPQAIEQLVKGFQEGNQCQTLLGVTGSGKTFTMANVIQEERDEAKREMIMEISIEEICDFPNHPFKIRMDEEMANLVESVKQYGVLSPVIVRPTEDGSYEMIAGHRRRYCHQKKRLLIK